MSRWQGLEPHARLETAARSNAECAAGAMIGRRAYVVDQGPSGGPEALVIVHADDTATGTIYGHLLRDGDGGSYISLLVRSDRFVSAPGPSLLFSRYHYWIAERLEYRPVFTTSETGAFARSVTLPEALAALEAMIAGFSMAACWPDQDGAKDLLPMELRVLEAYPIRDALIDGITTGPPR